MFIEKRDCVVIEIKLNIIGYVIIRWFILIIDVC